MLVIPRGPEETRCLQLGRLVVVRGNHSGGEDETTCRVHEANRVE